jgi:uncharacterized caspase-like protein
VVFSHGVQVKGRNYLLPVDTEIRAEDEVPAKSADLNEFLDRLGAMKQGINVVILDACRNNPFSGAEIVGPDGRRLKFRGATPSGLAAVDAPLGSMIAFSTAPGGVALDNPAERNSLYTKHLLEHLPVPGLPVELLFKRVRLAVAKETGRVQVPGKPHRRLLLPLRRNAPACRWARSLRERAAEKEFEPARRAATERCPHTTLQST